MKQCPVCQKDVSDIAVECPYCKAKMDIKPAADTIGAKQSSPVKVDYLAIVLLSLMVFFVNVIIQFIEFSYVMNYDTVKSLGSMGLLIYTAVNNTLSTMILTVLTALMISLVMRLFRRWLSSTKGFIIAALVVIVIFGLLHSLLTLPVWVLLVNSEGIDINQGKGILSNLILFNAILYPAYVLLGYWGITTLGKRKGYLAAGIGAFLLVLVMFLRAPLPAAMGLSWTEVYFVGFPIFAYLLFAGVLVIMKITTGRK